MSLENNLELNNQLVAKNNELLTELLSELRNSNKVFTPDVKPTVRGETKQIADKEETLVDINTLEFPTVVALSVLFKDEVHTLTTDKVDEAQAMVNATGNARNGQVDALDAALQGLPEVKALSNSRLIDLCIEMLDNWDDIPGITERREFALELLNEGKIHTKTDGDGEVSEPEPVINPKFLFKEAEGLILQLVKNGYRTEAVNILAKFNAKKLSQVAEESLAEMVALAKAALEG
ncbi:hypothetical protein [Photorhabdus heterorhabditis]|uniref:hypothetical protein n=1 Tax=Photorhabdus heterorhabditis TaxID=880156 RepID=UPI001562623B|nr:hypothetical protein [Photorhabdus heterorhabditis]NRN27882.1 hypothetical protein [Photorhabdus heterorhabditis subsp. aluminescens]